MEIQEKFRILSRGGRVLEVGASPGSWSIYALEAVAPTGMLVAVDLLPATISVRGGEYRFIEGDFRESQNRATIVEWGSYDTVLSDAAPNTTGSRGVDAACSSQLVEDILLLAGETLKSGGGLVAKIFTGDREGELLKIARRYFGTARMFKPKACRSGSFETYLIGLGYRGGGVTID